MSCLMCGDTGVMASGEKCTCGAGNILIIPQSIKIPQQYQGVKFDYRLLPTYLDRSYGDYMSQLLEHIKRPDLFSQNILICAPPNSGKTVFAYTVLSMLYAKGYCVMELMDIMEIREILLNFYYEDKNEVNKINEADVLFVKLPLDLPNKFPETMSLIIERRVRKGHSTIFLYSGTKEDLYAQDRFGKLSAVIGDGSYNSVEVKSWFSKERVE